MHSTGVCFLTDLVVAVGSRVHFHQHFGVRNTGMVPTNPALSFLSFLLFPRAVGKLLPVLSSALFALGA